MLRGTTTRRQNEERYTLGLPIISFTGNLAIEMCIRDSFNADIENHQGFVLEGGSIESD